MESLIVEHDQAASHARCCTAGSSGAGSPCASEAIVIRGEHHGEKEDDYVFFEVIYRGFAQCCCEEEEDREATQGLEVSLRSCRFGYVNEKIACYRWRTDA